jgi:glycosyltransferase involved in cell wall biosynthesis
MISICIPVYNYDIRELIKEIIVQCEELKLAYDLICVDDCSTNLQIEAINKLFIEESANSKIKYEVLSTNKGRSAIRNYLVSKSRFDYCWFLDCDGKISENKNLVKTFLQHLKENTVISGGRIYQKEIPKNKLLRLHWTWASKRELIDVSQRMKQPVQHFLSNNFVVHKDILLQIPFSEELNGYGYEDTFWASQIEKAGFQIQHIYNPVLHDGLEINTDFLNKIEESIINLIRLKNICIHKRIEFPVKSKLTNLAELLSKPIIKTFASIYFSSNKKKWKSKLLGDNYSLFIFDLYRLAFYFETIKKW